MNANRESRFTIVVYTADKWEHVCPIIRLVKPAEMGGIHLVRGNDWDGEELHVFPERLKEADIVVIQRDFPSHVRDYEEVIGLARDQQKIVVYELDDLLPELPDQHPDFYHYLTARTAIIRAIVDANGVVGSTPAICDYLRSFNPHAWVFPNYLNDQLWNLKPVLRRERSSVIIGYMGGHSHSYDLEVIVPVLERLLKRYSKQIYFKYGKQIYLKFWGIAPPPEIREWPYVEWLDVGIVNYEEFASYFSDQDCDIFIAPLRDNLFNRCKSHLKFLEYSALAVPGVYSRVTPYESVVENGVNGFLATSPQEWEQCLIRLIENRELREQIGAEAHATV